MTIGNVFTGKKYAEKQVKAFIEDLFRKSLQNISSSPDIREFTAKH
ncbi:MAG: hypothetical protein AABY49_08755 [Planctomycetota bacterium]